MGKYCLYASSLIFDRIIIKVAGNQDRHKSSFEFDFGPNQSSHFLVTCPWVTKISHIWTWISLKPVCQSWSNFMCSIIGVGERLHKFWGKLFIVSSSNLQVTRTTIKAQTSSNSGHICPLPTELPALEHWKKYYRLDSAFSFERIFVKLADNEDRHKSLQKFHF